MPPPPKADLLDDLDPLSPRQQAQQLNNSAAVDSFGLPLSNEETTVYAQLFKAADVSGTGSISANDAVAFLTKSRLPQNVLGEIWILSDSEQKGFLTQASFYRCLKLIALCQSGKPVSLQFIGSRRVGFNPSTSTPAPQKLVPQLTGSQTPSMSQQQSSSGFQLSNEERDRFVAAFNACSPANNLVTGASAKELFLKSGLPVDVLSRIWSLVDPQGANQLNLAQFMLAMLIITQMKSGSLQTVPPTPVPGSVSTVPATPAPISAALASPIRAAPAPANVAPPPSFDKRRSVAMRIPTQASFGSIPGVPPSNNEPWAIQSEEKALSDSHFETLDVGKKGYVTGQESYEFFLKSQDLANVSKSIGLSKDEFSVAMHLIKQAMAGQPLPETLPSNLVPPTLRPGFTQPPTSPSAAAPIPTSAPTQSAQQDLMGLGDITFEKAAPLPPFAAPQPQTCDIPSLNDDRSADISAARAQLTELQQKRDMLLPAQEELRAKRAANEIELQKVLLQKQELTLELTQQSATFEAETAIHMENLGLLQHEQQLLQLAQMEVEQAKQIVAAKLEEKNQVIAAIEAVKAEVADLTQYQEEINVMRPKFVEVHADLKKQLNQVEINKQLLISVTEEYKQLKADLSREEAQLDEEKKRLQALSSQVAVQSAINDKEKAKAQMIFVSLNETKGLSSSQAQSLSSLQEEAARGYDVPQPNVSAGTKSPALGSSRPKPPPPPSSRLTYGSGDLLEKRRSITSSVEASSGNDSTYLSTVVPDVAAVGPPPPMPPMFTKPKAGSSLTDVNPDTQNTSSAPVSTFAFDADFESAFAAVPLGPSSNNAAAFDDAFAVPAASNSNAAKAFDDAFSIPAPKSDANADAFAVPSTSSPKSAEVNTAAFSLPPPPSLNDGFDKIKRGSVAGTSIADSTRSGGRKRMTKLKSIDADSEFENAFGGAPVAAVTSTVSGTSPDIPVPDASKDGFNFDAAFAAPSSAFEALAAQAAKEPSTDAFAALDDAFSAAAAAPVAGASSSEAAKSGFDAFDIAFDLPSAAPATSVAPVTANSNVDDLEAVFGSSPSKVEATATPAVLNAEFNAAFAPTTTTSADAPTVSVADSQPVDSGNTPQANESNTTTEAVADTTNIRTELEKEATSTDSVLPEIKELMNLGFPKEKCIAALEMYDMDVAKASNYLLDHGAD
ncbi:hypothetical protein BCR33DRAFT_721771 [Rhizoclosmatium globosum]|uniref:EF-hand n=1 Tax=Rhizoclosmatium globosum TaxID=329046 RepID=A0A1Y2BQ49_9FUNG|nr:hypothetical protein BCR33DRAFT_721771 [Rhizoclosmatium globosum]|eukprot:ORY36836.1 hypothetical protein BCR33DRAFT_721771 [Rhizoclosmatium globosum]